MPEGHTTPLSRKKPLGGNALFIGSILLTRAVCFPVDCLTSMQDPCPNIFGSGVAIGLAPGVMASVLHEHELIPFTDDNEGDYRRPADEPLDYRIEVCASPCLDFHACTRCVVKPML